tara:strand:- start:2207 stop:3256 length:1050 start_codon:yes stop_codon:yes gene_type:complete
MKNILVTGGSGYIGSHTVRELQKSGFAPLVLDNFLYGHMDIVEKILKVPYIVGQVGDKKLLDLILSGNHPINKGQKIDAIMHFASYINVNESWEDPAKYYKNNFIETFNLLETILSPNHKRINANKTNNLIPIVFSSSCATYGIPGRNEIPISEDVPQNPINPYGRSKLMIEQILSDFFKAYGLASVSLRYFNAAGADPNSDIGENRNPETHLIPLTLDALTGHKEYINIYGNDYPTPDGTCIRDYIHVSDLAKAHVKALNMIKNTGGCKFYNLGTGKGHSVREVIELSEKITGLKIVVNETSRRDGDPPILVASSEKAYKELLWKPIYSDIQTIIKHAWNWYKFKNNL